MKIDPKRPEEWIFPGLVPERFLRWAWIGFSHTVAHRRKWFRQRWRWSWWGVRRSLVIIVSSDQWQWSSWRGRRRRWMTDCVKERNFALLGLGHTLRLLLEMIIEITLHCYDDDHWSRLPWTTLDLKMIRTIIIAVMMTERRRKKTRNQRKRDIAVTAHLPYTTSHISNTH